MASAAHQNATDALDNFTIQSLSRTPKSDKQGHTTPDFTPQHEPQATQSPNGKANKSHSHKDSTQKSKTRR